MKAQRGFIPAFLIPYIGYGLIAITALVILGYFVKQYNDWLIAPHEAKYALLVKTVENRAIESAEKLAAAKRENAELKLVYDKQAEVKDADYKKQIAAILARTNAGNGLRFNDPNGRNGCSPAREASKDSAATPEGTAASGQLSTELSNLLWAEAGRADQIAAYAESCHAFVNGK